MYNKERVKQNILHIRLSWNSAAYKSNIFKHVSTWVAKTVIVKYIWKRQVFKGPFWVGFTRGRI